MRCDYCPGVRLCIVGTLPTARYLVCPGCGSTFLTPYRIASSYLAHRVIETQAKRRAIRDLALRLTYTVERDAMRYGLRVDLTGFDITGL